MEIFKTFADAASLVFWNLANVFVLIAIFDGARRILLKSYSQSSILFVAIGFTYCFGMSGYSYFIANTLEDLAGPMSSAYQIEKLPEDWGDDLPPSDREDKTKSLASIYFEQTGSLAKSVDIEGNWNLYCPTSEDLEKRSAKANIDCQISGQVRHLRDVSMYWIKAAFIAALFGFVASNKKLRKEFGFAS